jgi:hypothetical protein
MIPIRIEVQNEEHSKIVQKMLFAIGCHWGQPIAIIHTEHLYLYVNKDKLITYGTEYTHFTTNPHYVKVNFDWAIPSPPERIITFDGKNIKLSEESFQSFKKQLKEG